MKAFTLEAKKRKVPYLGHDLFANIDEFVPMTISELDSVSPCFSYIENWILDNPGKDFSGQEIYCCNHKTSYRRFDYASF